MAQGEEFEEEVSSGDYRRSLIALRDLLAHELAGNRCGKCFMSQMRSGDVAALALRLQKVIEDIQKMPADDAEVTKLDELRARREGGGSGTPDTPHLLGSKNAQRRQGGRRTSGLSRPPS